MTSSFLVGFDDPASVTHGLTGGKGANLGLLTQAGFPVPAGFTVTTAAHATFLEADGLGAAVIALAETIDHDDPVQLDHVAAEIRGLIVGSELPEGIASQVIASYQALGPGGHVAVRSSGTAEDLAEASFAGMHDTYLDVQGPDAVLNAIKCCWASLWTARAASYRHAKGFDHSHGIAVVVQSMVDSEVSGVMFTANPLTAATDEIVVNASWGLGEAIVAGITTPDEFVLRAGTLRVKERTRGSKEKRVVRNPDTGVGTVAEDVPEDLREQLTLDDDKLIELARLGSRVQEHYGGFPQDIEWGYADGEFLLLQSRPVTGVDLSWDADVDAWQWLPEASADTVWTRAWSDDIWCGAISPLFYSYRALAVAEGYHATERDCGQPDLARLRAWKYFKGNVYFNCSIDAGHTARTAWPALRAGNLMYVPPAHHQAVIDAPFSVLSYLKLQAKLAFDPSTSAFRWLDTANRFMTERVEEANGLRPDELRLLSDQELKRHIDALCQLETEFIVGHQLGFFVHARDSFGALALMVAHWYDGDRATAFNDLITGCPRPTATIIENTELWRLTQIIRASPTLTTTFEEHEGRAFFEAAGGSEEGRAWLTKYESFVAEHGHRGHADRDMFYTRRAEDPAVDYRSIKAFLSADADNNPSVKDHETELRRQAFISEVADNLRAKSFGGLRANLFLVTLGYVDKFLMYRDDERHYIDRASFSVKRGFLELNRRLIERGVLDNEVDYLMLTREELYELFAGTNSISLAKAKIAGRSRHFEAVLRKESDNPLYLVGRRSADLEFDRAPGQPHDDKALHGVGTSAGTVVGVARVIHELSEIGRVTRDEILVTNSTDPGWTPVFSVIAAVVLETGGLLAHGSCLAREYGMPAVHLPRSTKLIPDGALIRIDGDAGTIELLEVPSPDHVELAEPIPA